MTVKTFSGITSDMLPINGDCHAAISQFCRGVETEGRFSCLDEFIFRLRQDYLDPSLPLPARAIRNINVDPRTWRDILVNVCGKVIGRVVEEYGVQLIAVYPWRGALAFVPACCQYGLTQHCHLGIRRDEKHPDTTDEVWMEPDLNFFENLGAVKRVLIVDPMLATGGSIKTVIKKLLEIDIPEERIIVANVVAAPEGVYNLLNEFPRIRIYTAVLDTYLDKTGYIVPGLGDVGDKFFDRLDIAFFEKHRNVFTFFQWATLNECIKRANPLSDIVA